jgi:replicative DNA helicase
MSEEERDGRLGPLLVGDRPLPHNDDAEVAVLGAVLLDPQAALDVAASRLGFPGSFHNPAHQTVFDLLLELSNSGSRGGIDLVTLADALDKRGMLDQVGGPAYLGRLMGSVPSAANIEQYVSIVHEHALLRRLVRAGADIVEACYSGEGSTREVIDRIETEIMGITSLGRRDEAVPVGAVVIKAIEMLDKLHRRDSSVMGLQTGYPDLDSIIGGLRGGEMFVLAARPSIGKTALALNMVSNVTLRDDPAPTCIFSLEMSTELLVLRLLCSLARVNLGDIRDGALSPSRWQEIMTQGQRLREAPIFIDDTGGLDIVELRARARRMWREHGIRLIVIDYLQLLKGTGLNRNTTRENEVSQISGGIKNLAKELDIPVVVLAQLNRQAAQQGALPRLSHLRESGAIEQDADVVALLHRERETEKDGAGAGGTREGMEAKIVVAKHRNGPTGIVNLTFLPQFTRFESQSMIQESDVPDANV